MLFVGVGGLTAFYPDQVRDNTNPPRVLVSAVNVFDQPVPDYKGMDRGQGVQSIELPHDQNDITFEYVGLHYTDPARNSYEYRLEQLDEDWVTAGTVRAARYPALGHGNYTFRVRAANSDGIWSQPTSVEIRIKPPWWRTIWA